jgi:hypothetical protein
VGEEVCWRVPGCRRAGATRCTPMPGLLCPHKNAIPAVGGGVPSLLDMLSRKGHPASPAARQPPRWR